MPVSGSRLADIFDTVPPTPPTLAVGFTFPENAPLLSHYLHANAATLGLKLVSLPAGDAAEQAALVNRLAEQKNVDVLLVEELDSVANARGSEEIAETISAVALAAQSASAGALDTDRAAAELSRMASSMQALVNSSRPERARACYVCCKR